VSLSGAPVAVPKKLVRSMRTTPSALPVEMDLPWPQCEAPLSLREGARGPWLGCSKFAKCRGRGKWSELDEAKRAELEKTLEAHMAAHPIPIIRTLDGTPLTDARGKPLAEAPRVEELLIDEVPSDLAASA